MLHLRDLPEPRALLRQLIESFIAAEQGRKTKPHDVDGEAVGPASTVGTFLYLPRTPLTASWWRGGGRDLIWGTRFQSGTLRPVPSPRRVSDLVVVRQSSLRCTIGGVPQ